MTCTKKSWELGGVNPLKILYILYIPKITFISARYTLLLEPSDPKVERPRDSLPAISILALKLSRYLEHPLSTLTPPDNLKLTNKLGT